MKTRVVYVERKPSESVSIERVFRQIAKDLPAEEFDVSFQSMPYGNGIAAILKNLLFFRPEPSDIYHITGDVHYISLILPPSKTILTIHDLIFLHRRSGLRRWVLKKFYLDLPLRRVRQVTVPSQAVKGEILRFSDIDESRIHVVENPLIEGFTEQASKPFNGEQPVILHIGTAANKNLANLIKAVAGISCKLKIVGALDVTIRELLDITGIIYENAVSLNESEIIEEYRNADIVAFCSSYEGFGLPIIEAQAMRRVVITSDLPPMNHVAGEGALLVDPNDISAIRNGIVRIINDSRLREELIAAGSENIKRFDSKSAAASYAELYRDLLAESHAIG